MKAKNWWKQTTIYQIYPISFFDSDGDGTGDLNGIIEKLDYIEDLGFETIWISPFYKSPMRDFGYDISDYFSINPMFGSMDDTLRLIKEVHKRKMKIVFDMVMNHTSDQHEWFKESRKSPDNPKRDWYIWKKGKGRNGKKRPNNWFSMIGRRGWNYDKTTNEWYYTSFLPFQPDLNYNNPEVKKAMFDAVRFWLKKGVDGFRLDIFNCIMKDKEYRNNPFSFRFIPSPNNNDVFFQHKKYNMNRKENYELAKELRSVIDEFSPEKFLIGEVSGKDNVIKDFLGEKNDGLNLIFLFETVNFKFRASYFKKIIKIFEKTYSDPYTPVFVYSNHDVRRCFSKIKEDDRKVKLLSLVQFTVRSVPVIYYGEEVGMTDLEIPFWKAKDPLAKNYKFIPKILTDLIGLYINRDGCRTPMQWDSSRNAGFSSAEKPWLGLSNNYKSHNVELEEKDENSILMSYKNLLALRKKYAALSVGELKIIDTYDRDVLTYRRRYQKEEFTIMCNFSTDEIKLKRLIPGDIIYSTEKGKSSLKTLSAYEGIIIKNK